MTGMVQRQVVTQRHHQVIQVMISMAQVQGLSKLIRLDKQPSMISMAVKLEATNNI